MSLTILNPDGKEKEIYDLLKQKVGISVWCRPLKSDGSLEITCPAVSPGSEVEKQAIQILEESGFEIKNV